MIYDLHGAIGYQISTLARTLERETDILLAEYQLTRITWVTLVSIGANSLSQPSKIAEYLGIDRPAVSRAIAALEKLGYITRMHASPDARRVVVQATREGIACLEALMPKKRASNEEFLSKLTEEEQREFRRLLSILIADRPSLSHL